MRKNIQIKGFIGVLIVLSMTFGNLSAQWTPVNINGGYISYLAKAGDTLFAITGIHGDGLFISTDEGNSWSEVISNSLPTSKKVIAKFGNSLFLGCGSVFEGEGIYRSDDNGITWVKKSTKPMWVTCFAQHGSTIFAGTGEGLLRSTDNGGTWEYANNGLEQSPPHIYSLLVAENEIYVGIGESLGIYRSANNGDTWVQASTGMQIGYNEGNYYYPYITSLAYIGDAIYAGSDGNDGIWKSVDGGDFWVLTSTASFDYSSIKAIVGKDSLLFAASVYNGVIRSVDGGNSWSGMNGNGISIWAESNALVMSNENVLVGTKGTIYKSADYGDNWNESDSGVHAFSMTNPPVLSLNSNLYSGTMTSGIFRSKDNGDNWTAINEGFPVNDLEFLRSISSNSTTLFAASVISDDGGDSWHSTEQDSVFPWVEHNGSLYTYGPTSGVSISNDNGTTWKNIESSHYLYLSLHSDGTTLFLGAYEGYYYSTDNGNNWQQSIFEGATGYICVNNFISTPTAKIVSIIGGGRRGIYQSVDNGANWKLVHNMAVTKLINSDNKIYASGTLLKNINGEEVEYPTILLSEDDGISWEVISGALGSNLSLYSMVVFDGKIIIPSNTYPDYGIYCSIDKGTTWKEIGTGLVPGTFVSILSVADKYIYAGTFNSLYRRGIDELSIPSQPSGITGKITPCISTAQTYSVEDVSGVNFNWQVPSDWNIITGQSTNSITVLVGSEPGYISVIPSNEFGTGLSQIIAVTPVDDFPAKPDNIDGSVTPIANTAENYSVTN
ncbi:MAG: hypothetical protein M0P66_18460, partial [Salinivirgaceae bacterium]|nr:hypothetical protein [Salinivirgaceae bacterium]